jgi:hypothetical protein
MASFPGGTSPQFVHHHALGFRAVSERTYFARSSMVLNTGGSKRGASAPNPDAPLRRRRNCCPEASTGREGVVVRRMRRDLSPECGAGYGEVADTTEGK